MLCTLLCKQVSHFPRRFSSLVTALLLLTPLSFLLCSLFTLLSEIPKVTPQLQFSGAPVTVLSFPCVQACPQTPAQLLLC